MAVDPQHDTCPTSQFGPLCKNLKQSSACCVILESITDGVFAVDRDQRIICFLNRAAERITRYTVEEAVGRCRFDVFRSAVCQTGCLLTRTIATG